MSPWDNFCQLKIDYNALQTVSTMEITNEYYFDSRCHFFSTYICSWDEQWNLQEQIRTKVIYFLACFYWAQEFVRIIIVYLLFLFHIEDLAEQFLHAALSESGKYFEDCDLHYINVISNTIFNKSGLISLRLCWSIYKWYSRHFNIFFSLFWHKWIDFQQLQDAPTVC